MDDIMMSDERYKLLLFLFMKAKTNEHNKMIKSIITCGGSYIVATVARIPSGTFSCFS